MATCPEYLLREILRVGVKQVGAAGEIGQPAIRNFLVFMVRCHDDATAVAIQTIGDTAARMVQRIGADPRLADGKVVARTDRAELLDARHFRVARGHVNLRQRRSIAKNSVETIEHRLRRPNREVDCADRKTNRQRESPQYDRYADA